MFCHPLHSAMMGNSVTFVQVALHWCDTLCDFSFLLGVILLGELCVTGTTSLIHRSPVSQKPNKGEISQRYPKNIPNISQVYQWLNHFPRYQDTHVSIVNGNIATGLKCHWIPGWNIHHSDLLHIHMWPIAYDTCAMCNGSYMTYCICLNTGSVRVQQQCLNNTSWLGLFSGTVFVCMYLCICICICMYFYTAAAVSA